MALLTKARTAITSGLGNGRRELIKRFVWYALLMATAVWILDYAITRYAADADGWPLIWPINGIALPFLLTTRRRYWVPLVAVLSLGTGFGQMMHGDPLIEIAVNALCNAFEILVAASMLPRFTSLQQWLREPHIVLRFLVAALILGPCVDGLTGIANRRRFDEALQSEWKRALREDLSMAVLLLDVDCFKRITIASAISRVTNAFARLHRHWKTSCGAPAI